VDQDFILSLSKSYVLHQSLGVARSDAPMNREALVRRAVHASIALAPLYYVIPLNLPVCGWHRWTLVVMFFAGIMLFEAYRLRRGMTFLGLRPHEKGQIASFAWAAAGITAVLWLCPHDIAAAALVGMALVDPVAGEMRRAGYGRRATVPLSIAMYFCLAASVLVLWDLRADSIGFVLAAVAAVLAVASESVKVRYVDDDFLMSVVPAAAMNLLALTL